jgi:hypothetical protein
VIHFGDTSALGPFRDLVDHKYTRNEGKSRRAGAVQGIWLYAARNGFATRKQLICFGVISGAALGLLDFVPVYVTTTACFGWWYIGWFVIAVIAGGSSAGYLNRHVAQRRDQRRWNVDLRQVLGRNSKWFSGSRAKDPARQTAIRYCAIFWSVGSETKLNSITLSGPASSLTDQPKTRRWKAAPAGGYARDCGTSGGLRV